MNDWNKNIQKHKWEKNKYSIYADLGLGALFFIAGKITEDLIFASFVGVAGGFGSACIATFCKDRPPRWLRRVRNHYVIYLRHLLLRFPRRLLGANERDSAWFIVSINVFLRWCIEERGLLRSSI